MNQDLQAVVAYMKLHWPSQVKKEWQVPIEAYPAIVKKVVTLWGKNASKGRELVRLAGLSGSGKTTQLLPAIEAYFKNNQKQPILVAARRFVEFHPYYQEILNEYGEANLRKMTDEFATIMLFLTIFELLNQGYDVILDVTLLDPQMEAVLIQLITKNNYKTWLTMVAVSPQITERFLGERAWRHTKETEQEFIRATNLALNFYIDSLPNMRIVLWDVWDAKPIYDGEIKNSLETWQKYSQVTNFTSTLTENDLREAKIRYLAPSNTLN